MLTRLTTSNKRTWWWWWWLDDDSSRSGGSRMSQVDSVDETSTSWKVDRVEL